jgi:non-specific serine/threonine protein kinase
LIESGEGAAVRRRHRDWFLALAEQAEQALQGAEQAAWLDRLEMEHDNLRAALAWCQAEDEGIEAGLRLGAALRRFWYVRGYLSEGREWLEKALSRRSRAPAALQAKALNEAGILTGAQSDYAAARRFHEESLEIRRTLNDRRGVAASLNNLGLVSREQGDTARARSYYEESLKTYRELGDAARTAIVLLNLGVVATEQGDDTAAQQLLEEALDIERTLGDQWLIAVALHNLGEVAHKQNDDLTAQQLFRESLTLRRELGNRSGIALILTSMAYTARSQGDAERTARLLGAVEVLREALNAPLSPADRADYDHNVAAARAALGEETFAAAWAQGRSSPLEQVIAYALGQTET